MVKLVGAMLSISSAEGRARDSATSTRWAGPRTSRRSSTASHDRPTSSTTADHQEKGPFELIYSPTRFSPDRVRREEDRTHPRPGGARESSRLADDKVRDGFVSLRRSGAIGLRHDRKAARRKELITACRRDSRIRRDASGCSLGSRHHRARPSMGKTLCSTSRSTGRRRPERRHVQPQM